MFENEEKSMYAKTSSLPLVACVWALFVPMGVADGAEVGTAFTYQGKLEDVGGPITDTCDFEFGLWNDPAGGGQVGNSPQSALDVTVEGGLFTTLLDFGPNALTGEARWLEMAVCCPSPCAVQPLSPRQELTPVPHALALPGMRTQWHPASPNIIGGFEGNSVVAGVAAATVSGGGSLSQENRVNDSGGTVGGGSDNAAGIDDGDPGAQQHATVAGGQSNAALNTCATVGGGESNTADGSGSVVAGGRINRASGVRASVGGGEANIATLDHAAIAGGVSNLASGIRSSVGGGESNTASGSKSTVPGGEHNTAGGDDSFAAGQRAQANHHGSFVWSDGSTADPDFFASTADNQFLIKAGGGVGIGTATPGEALDVVGNVRASGEVVAAEINATSQLKVGLNSLIITENSIGTTDGTPIVFSSPVSFESNSDCCAPHAGSGCGNSVCQAAVCGVQAACCVSPWDQPCVDTAVEMCSEICGPKDLTVSGVLRIGSNSIDIDGDLDVISATSGRISFDNEDLVTMGKVGIGTTSINTSGSLDVADDMHIGGGDDGSVDGSEEFLNIRGLSTNWVVGVQNAPSVNDTGFFIGQTGSQDDTFHINQAGNVGIGTNDPQAKLHVGGASGVDGIMFPDDTVQTTAYTGAPGGGNTLDQAYDQGGAGAGRIINADSGALEVVSDSSEPDTVAIYAKLTGTPQFSTRRPAAIYAETTQGVGITCPRAIYAGTTAPYGIALEAHADNGIAVYATADVGTALNAYAPSPGFAANLIGRVHVDAGTDCPTGGGFGDGILMMVDGYGGCEDSTALRVTSEWNSTAIHARAEFGGVAVEAEQWGFSGTAVHAVSTSDDSKGVHGVVSGANSYAAYFEGGENYFEGNVGIGTTDPGVKLEVEADGGTAGLWVKTFEGTHSYTPLSIPMAIWGGATSDTADRVVGVSGNASGNAEVRVGVSGSASGPDVGSTGGSFRAAGTGVYGETDGASDGKAVHGKAIYSNNHAAYFEGGRNYFEGNVGIGTTDPTEALEVEGAIMLDGVSELSQPAVFWSVNSTRRASAFLDDGGTLGRLKFGRYDPAGVFGGHMMTFDLDTGDVGIGTSNPQGKLDVNGTIRASGTSWPNLIIHDSNGSNDRPGIQFTNNSMFAISGDDASDETFGFYSTYGYARTYDAQIAVYGKAANSWGTYLGLTHDGTDGRIYTDVGDIVLDPAGNVGIGVLSPQAKLHIGGASGVDGIRFPDGTLQTTAYTISRRSTDLAKVVEDQQQHIDMLEARLAALEELVNRADVDQQGGVR